MQAGAISSPLAAVPLRQPHHRPALPGQSKTCSNVKVVGQPHPPPWPHRHVRAPAVGPQPNVPRPRERRPAPKSRPKALPRLARPPAPAACAPADRPAMEHALVRRARILVAGAALTQAREFGLQFPQLRVR